MLRSLKGILKRVSKVDTLDEIKEIKEINLLTEDDAVRVLKKKISNLVDAIISKTIARTDELGEFEGIDQIEEVIKRNRRRRQRFKQGVILALAVLIIGCAVSISSSIGKYAARVRGIFVPLKKVDYLLEAGQPEKAYSVLKRIDIKPDNAQQVEQAVGYYLQIADYYFLTPGEVAGSNMKKAVKIYETILMKFATLDPGLNAKVSFRLGRCFEQLFLYSRAIDSFARAAELVPGSELAEEALYRIGLNHLHNDAYEKAREVFAAFVDRYPESQLVRNVFYRIGDSHHLEAEFLSSRIDL